MNVLDLFSGIGGFSLGLERAGMRTVAFCEIEDFARRVLAKHWPHIPCYSDVRELTADRLRADGISVDVICGGFPCQDISEAGKRVGITGAKSGLWFEYARLIGELRPQFVIVENVADLLNRGFDEVLSSLAALRYDAEWHSIPAYYVGSPQIRDRVWIVAYPSEGPSWSWGNACLRESYQINWPRLVHAGRSRRDHGLPGWVDRVGACGNSVVPKIPEAIGRAIMASSHARNNDQGPDPIEGRKS